MNIVAVVPVSGSDLEYQKDEFLYLNNKNILDYTLDILVSTQALIDVIVSTDSVLIANYIEDNYSNVKLYFRDDESKNKDLSSVIDETVSDYEKQNLIAIDYVVQSWINYPFRKQNLIKRVINIIEQDLSIDSLFCSGSEFNTYWYYDGSEVNRITTDRGRSRKSGKPILRDLKGLCSIAKRINLKNGYFIGGDIATYSINDHLCTINIHEHQDLYIAKLVAQNYNPFSNEDIESNEETEFSNSNQVYKYSKRNVLSSNKFLSKGSIITREDIEIVKSEIGIEESKLEKVLNKKLAYDLEKNKTFTFGWLV